MAQEFRLPDPGEGIHEAQIVDVHISEGDHVADGDALFTVETDKAVTDVPSPFDGRVVEIMAHVNDVIEVGSVLLTYEPAETGASDAQEGSAEQGASEEEARDEPESEDETEPEDEDVTDETEDEVEPEDEDEPDEPAGTDKPDETEAEMPEAMKKTATPSFVEEQRPVPASPATRALARRLHVDLHELEGSGPEGRIEPEDVKAAAESTESEPDTREERDEAQEDPDEVDFERWGPVERVPVDAVRRSIAEAMTTSWQRIPHVDHHDVADVTDLERLRRDHSHETRDDAPLTMTAFLLKAAVAALRVHPRFNASYSEKTGEVILKRYHHIGVAVDTDEGLIVPVIRDVDSKPIAVLAAELAAMAADMRAGDRNLEDLQGGTFTITNPGGIGGTGFAPIIRHPEVAILGAARARWEPTFRGDPETEGRAEIVPRFKLPLVVAFDHRVNDGADAARFLRTVVESLEDPARLLLRS